MLRARETGWKSVRLLYALLFAGAATLLVSRPVEAQWMDSDIGVTAGYNRTSVSGSDVQNGGSISAFFVGVSAIRKINPMVSFQPELLYARRGATARDDDGTFDVKGTTDYIDIPLLLKLSIGEAMTGMRPSVHFGPYVGVNLTCNFSGQIEYFAIDDACEKFEASTGTRNDNPFLVKTHSIDYGVIAGAGLDVGNLGVFARYQMGLATISDGFDLKHRVISVGARWSFMPLRK